MKKFLLWLVITVAYFVCLELFMEYCINQAVNDAVFIIASVIAVVCTGLWTWYTLRQIFKLLRV